MAENLISLYRITADKLEPVSRTIVPHRQGSKSIHPLHPGLV